MKIYQILTDTGLPTDIYVWDTAKVDFMDITGMTPEEFDQQSIVIDVYDRIKVIVNKKTEGGDKDGNHQKTL